MSKAFDLSDFQKVGGVDMDLCCAGILSARKLFLEKNGCLPNAVVYGTGRTPVLSIAHTLTRDYGLVLPFIESSEIGEFSWRVIFVGNRDTISIGSNGV